eukprot:TRINITY_DN16048_c0_g1_i2.p1 TRINITY_DN16048_c0_g1~~TRINITY_DN16048_c0_g1_i2.p1  ORF type:complete len:423 (-),score=76.52 TRINITY_DN16048_c0_g1_i2:299-1567(-)
MDELGKLERGHHSSVIKEQQLATVFAKNDLCGKGISHEDMSTTLQDAGVDIRRKDVKQLLKQFDEKHQGNVDFQSFMDLVRCYDEARLRYGRSASNVGVALDITTCDSLKQLFDHYDRNHSGYISRKELSLAFQEAGLDMKKKTVRRVLETFDVNQSGGLELAEFMKLVASYEILKEVGEATLSNQACSQRAPPRKGSKAHRKKRMSIVNESKGTAINTEEGQIIISDAKLKDIFHSYDLNGEGTINREELTKAFERTGVKMTEKETLAVLETFDENSSGDISLAEFQKLVQCIDELVTCWEPTGAEAVSPKSCSHAAGAAEGSESTRAPEEDQTSSFHRGSSSLDIVQKVYACYEDSRLRPEEEQALKSALGAAGIELNRTDAREMLRELGNNNSIEFEEFVATVECSWQARSEAPQLHIR